MQNPYAVKRKITPRGPQVPPPNWNWRFARSGTAGPAPTYRTSTMINPYKGPRIRAPRNYTSTSRFFRQYIPTRLRKVPINTKWQMMPSWNFKPIRPRRRRPKRKPYMGPLKRYNK